MKQAIIALAVFSILTIGLTGSAYASNGAAPSMSGWSSFDKERVSFEGVAATPIYLMTNSAINIIQGQATEQFVKVFFDGKLIETIDIGAAPSGTPHNEWLGFNEYVEIPFEAYYEITEEGQILSHGRGNQNATYDLDGNKIFLDGDGDPITEE